MRVLRKRARQACTACNQKRIKCNVTDELPCRNCVQGDTQCQVRESRRGKHPRPSRATARNDQNTPIPQRRQLDEVAASEALANLSRDRQEEHSPADLPDRDLGVEVTPTQTQTYDVLVDGREEENALFLGESTSIRYVHDDSSPHQPSDNAPPKLFHRVKAAARAKRRVPEWETERRAAKIKSLQAEGVFSFPDKTIVEEMLSTYFKWFHPCFAVVDEQTVLQQYKNGLLSPLLLNTLLFISIIYLGDKDLRRMGLGSKEYAKHTFYMRAKDLYDADYEKNKLTVIQSLFLTSFIRVGPSSSEKDVRHWLAVAIALAQTKALHRATSLPVSPLESLKKRLWWSIYVREMQCAAGLGLPNRIRDEDCDVGPLEYQDFAHAFGDATSSTEKNACIAYQIHMSELGRVLGLVMVRGYLPGRALSAPQQDEIKGRLHAWKQRLPAAMQLDSQSDEPPSMQASMLHLAYNNLLILLHRQEHIAGHEGGAVAMHAASRNTRIVEDMMSDGNMLRHAQVHVITNLFNTLCLYTIQLRRVQGTAIAIAEHRAKVCLLGLKELQKTWGVQNWILQLFFQYLDRSTASRLLTRDERESTPPISVSRLASRRASPTRDVESTSHKVPTELSPDATEFAVDTDTPWSWSTEEQNQFLFSSIEHNFAFGEGEIFDWSLDNLPESSFYQLNDLGECCGDSLMKLQ